MFGVTTQRQLNTSTSDIFLGQQTLVACYAVRKTAKDNEAVYPGKPALVSGTFILMICMSASHQMKTPQIELGISDMLAGLNPELRATGGKPDNILSLQRVVGLPWDSEKDTYLIQPESHRKAKDIRIPTQRSLLKITSSIFDPSTVKHSFAMYYAACLEHRTTMGQTYFRRSTR